MFLLEQTENTYVIKVLTERLRLSGGVPKTYFVDNVTDNNYLDRLEVRQDVLGQVQHALKLALTDDGRLYPTALLDILNGLSAGDAVIVDIIEKVRSRLTSLTVVTNGTPPGYDCFQDTELIYGNPFLNRKHLRIKLRQILTPLGNPFFLVNGTEGSGKSYTQKLVDHCSMVSKNYVAAALLPPLKPDDGADQLPEILAQEILSAMSIIPDMTTIPHRDEKNQTKDQYAKLLASWLLRHVRQEDPNFYCIVLDGYGCEQLNSWTRSFLRTFTSKIVGGAFYRQKIRLVLISHSAEELEILDGYYEEEIVELVTRKDVRGYIESALTKKGMKFEDKDITVMIEYWLGSPGDDRDTLTPLQLKDVNKALKGMN